MIKKALILRCVTTLESCVYRAIGFLSDAKLSCIGVPIRDECGAFSSVIRLLVLPPCVALLEPASIGLVDLSETVWWYACAVLAGDGGCGDYYSLDA